MKTWFSIICLGVLSLQIHAEQKELNSAIQKVTVYNDRAAVLRHAEIELPAGKHELTFKKLPANIDTNSIQVNAVANVPATILEVASHKKHIIAPTNERLKEIAEQQHTIQEQLSRIEDQITIINNQSQFIMQAQKTAVAANTKAKRPVMNETQEVMQFSKQALTTLFLEKTDLDTQIKQLNKQLEQLTHESNSLKRQRNLQANDVTLTVDLEQAGKVAIDLTYITFGARWQPIYDAKVSTKSRNISLNYLALVNQQTGEDWNNIKLTLSTARPSLGANIPKLGDWKISEYNPNLVGSLRQRNSSGAFKQTGFQTAAVDNSSTNAAFTMQEAISLNSGNAEQKVMITNIELPSKLQYQTTPRIRQLAYLQASTVNNSNYPLLAGKLNIFMDGRFIATSTLKTTMPNEPFKLDLGGDESIAVTYKKLKNYTEKTGLINSNQRITYESLITIQNNKATTEMLTIYDQIPVSQNEKITVTLRAPNKGATKDKEGKLMWNLSLTPNEKIEIPVTFSVEYPINTKVVGL